MNPIKTARIAGALYLLMVPLGVFGILYIPANFIIPGDAATTASNIMNNEFIFRLSIVSALCIQLIQIFLVLALYQLLKPVSKNIARIMVILILVAVPIAMLNELNQLAVLLLLNGTNYLTVFTTDQLQAFSLIALELHNKGIIIAQIFWGLWLFPMGYLVFKSGYIPGVLGILLMIGCFGYLLDSFLLILFPDFGVTFSEFTFLGEVLLPLWLLIKGVNLKKWEEHT